MRRPVEKPYFAIRESENYQDRLAHEEIETRAYQIYIERGQSDGHDVEDWLQAEQQLLAKQANPRPMKKRAAA